MLSIDKEKISQIKSKGNKFIRRTDLTSIVRLNIAYSALMAILNGKWGIITALSREFMISRTFVYMLAFGILHIPIKVVDSSWYEHPPKSEKSFQKV